jgi:biopolymer transport protein ExbB/TolQ
MGALGILAAWLGLALVWAVATLWWSRRLWKRRRELPLWMKVVGLVVAASAVFGGFGTVVGLVKALGAVGGESVDPAQQARMLAEGIAEAMNCTAMGIALWLPSVIVLTIVTRR